MFRKIISIALCLTLFVGQMTFARGSKTSRRGAQHANHQRNVERIKAAEAAKKRETQKQQGHVAAGQAGQAAQEEGSRQQKLAHFEQQLKQAVDQGKRQDAFGVIAGLAHEKKITEEEAMGLIERLGLGDLMAQVQGQAQGQAGQQGSSLWSYVKGLGRTIVANPIRSVLFAVGTIAAARYVYKYGLWSKLKEWWIESRDSLKEVVELYPGKVIQEEKFDIVKKAVPTGKALRDLFMGRWVKTLPYRAWKSVKTFVQEAATIVKQHGIPEVKKITPRIVIPAGAVIDNKEKMKMAWEIVKDQGGKLIDILSPLEHPVSRAMGGVGL